MSTLVEELPPAQRLALNYASRRARPATLALLALDARLAAILSQRREPIAAQLRLAWWRETLAKPSAQWPRGEPVLDALRGWRDTSTLAGLAEGFEAKETKAGKLHARLPGFTRKSGGERKPARPPSVQASEHAVDDRRQFRNRQGPFVGIPVDEEGWGRVHLELFRAPFLHRSHIVQKLLVRQAGLEGLL